MSFISDLLDSTADVESPRNYFYWSGLTAIASVLGKRVYLNRQKKYNLYPNIYTFLLSSESGLLRKSLPINTAKKLAYLAGNVRIIDGQNSIQGIIKELNNVHTTDKRVVISDAQALLISGEFSNFLIQDRDAKPLTDLTDMYDTQNYEDGFKKRLASQDILILKGLCLTGLYGSNEVHFRRAVPDEAVRGGFLARCFCVYETKRQTINSLMSLTEDEEEDALEIPVIQLSEYLKTLIDLRGEMRVVNEARRLYNSWYHDFTTRDIEDDTGTIARLGDTLLKAAMLISLSRDPEMLIRLQDMEEAIQKSTDCFLNMRKMLLGGKLDTQNDTFRIVMHALLNSKDNRLSRRVLLVKGWGIFSVYDLDSVIEHFVQSGAIIVEGSGEKYYRLQPWVVEKHELGKAKED